MQFLKIFLIIYFTKCNCTEVLQEYYKLLRHPDSGLKMCPAGDVLEVSTTKSQSECVFRCLRSKYSIFEYSENNGTCKIYDEYQKNINQYIFSDTCAAMRAIDRCAIHLRVFSTNLAFQRPTVMSSTTIGRLSAYAVNGKRLGNWDDPVYRVAGTQNTAPFQWFSLDLVFMFFIKNVALWPRIDCCKYRIDRLMVKMSRNKDLFINPRTATNSFLCNLTYLDMSLDYFNASCMNCNFGFRYIALISTQFYPNDFEINLAEIEVYGSPENCPNNFVYSNPWNKCMLMLDNSLSWQESINVCQNYKSSPVNSNSTNKTDYILGFKNEKLSNTSLIWTSGFWDVTSGFWSWWGMATAILSPNWQNGEPGADQCIALNLTNLTLQGEPCSTKLQTICQIYLNSA